MAREERSDDRRDNSDDDTQRQRPREFANRTPGKAEGEEKTVDEALKNQEEKKRR